MGSSTTQCLLDDLPSTIPFRVPSHHLSTTQRAILSYERAKAIGLASGLTVFDIASLTKKFWEFHLHPIVAFDGAATTLLTIQYTLVIGTLAQYAAQQPDLIPLMDDLLNYRKLGQFLLTERGHGLDAKNLETTATLLPSGEFVLNTPCPQAVKYMPPTIPVSTPCVGIVFARLIVNGEFKGIRPFLVALNDGVSMCTGVSAKLLPPRGGTDPVNHSLTYFDNVRLPRTALLCSSTKSENPGADFQRLIWRVAVGSLALATIGVDVLEVCVATGFLYSMRRMVTAPTGDVTVPIFHFRTQQIPILTATAQAHVLKAFSRWATDKFSNEKISHSVRHGVAVCAKATVVQAARTASLAIADRCGAQGLFEVNQLFRLFNDLRGLEIAEGDVLVLSIRLAMELLLGRCEVPPSTNPTSFLARHEASMFAELSAIVQSVSHHRAAQVNRKILPRCRPFIEAIGDRMAYDAAVESGVMPCLIDLYEASALRHDTGWYAENVGLSRQAQVEMQERALDAVLPHVAPLVEQLGVKPYLTAPIVSDNAWDMFVAGLEEFDGHKCLGRPEAVVMASASVVEGKGKRSRL